MKSFTNGNPCIPPRPQFMGHWSPKGDFPGSPSSRGKAMRKERGSKEGEITKRDNTDLCPGESGNAHLGHREVQVTPTPLLEGSQPHPAPPQQTAPEHSLDWHLAALFLVTFLLFKGLNFTRAKAVKLGKHHSLKSAPSLMAGKGLKPPGKGLGRALWTQSLSLEKWDLPRRHPGPLLGLPGARALS